MTLDDITEIYRLSHLYQHGKYQVGHLLERLLKRFFEPMEDNLWEMLVDDFKVLLDCLENIDPEIIERYDLKNLKENDIKAALQNKELLDWFFSQEPADVKKAFLLIRGVLNESLEKQIEIFNRFVQLIHNDSSILGRFLTDNRDWVEKENVLWSLTEDRSPTDIYNEERGYYTNKPTWQANRTIKLLRLADSLDRKGFYREANIIDEVLV